MIKGESGETVLTSGAAWRLHAFENAFVLQFKIEGGWVGFELTESQAAKLFYHRKELQ